MLHFYIFCTHRTVCSDDCRRAQLARLFGCRCQFCQHGGCIRHSRPGSGRIPDAQPHKAADRLRVPEVRRGAGKFSVLIVTTLVTMYDLFLSNNQEKLEVMIVVSGWMEEDEDDKRTFGVIPSEENISLRVRISNLCAERNSLL